MADAISILLPEARMIGGNVYQLIQAKDFQTKEFKFNKDGTPEMWCSIGVAIRKGAEQHWNQTEWGVKVWNYGSVAFPQHFSSTKFSWKISDGDSTEPNEAGKRNCDNANYRGHWIIWMKQAFLTTIGLRTTGVPVTLALPPMVNGEYDLSGDHVIVPGYFVQVMLGVRSNTGAKAGLYMNPKGVLLVAAGERIVSSGMDLSEFGSATSAALPVGAVPLAAAPVVAAFATPAAPITVQPNAAFMTAPARPAQPAQPAAPVDPVYEMTEKAGTFTREAYLATPGWTDEILIAQGFMRIKQ